MTAPKPAEGTRDPWSFFSSGGSGGGGLGAGDFSESISSSSGSAATAGYTPGGSFDSVSDFPDWLREPDTEALENEYANVDSFFKIGPKVKPMKNLANAQFSNALQQGANAADESIARSFQSGVVGSINTSIISAQTAMPALLAKMGAEKDIAGLRINNMYKQQQARAALAAQIASMKKSYVDTMAQYALGQDRLGLESYLGESRLDLEREGLDFAQEQYADRREAESGPSYEEMATVMGSMNRSMGNPTATNFWQQFGAGLGGVADRPAKVGWTI